MRFLIAFLVTLFISIDISLAQGHEIKIQITDNKDSTAIIGYHFGKQKLVYDTLTFDGSNSLLLSGEEVIPPGLYFVYTPGFYFEFIVNEQFFSISTTLNGGYDDLKITDSRENELFKKFQNTMIGFQREQMKLTDSIKNNPTDSISLQQTLANSFNSMKEFRDKLVEENGDTFFARFISMQSGISVPEFNDVEDPKERSKLRYEYYKDHYFDLIEDPASLLRTPVFNDYVIKYFDDLVLPVPDSIIVEIDRFLERTEYDKSTFRYWLVTFFKKYQESKIMGQDAIWIHLSEKYYLSGVADWISDESVKQIAEEVRFVKPNLIGNPAPFLNAVDTALKPFDLGQLESRYLVLFFYDPDCGHCKKKTPVLKDNYPLIKENGGEVIAVCTISDVDKWKKYVRENELNWINLGDPFGRSNFRVDYNVRSTPQVYVLDSERKIVGKKLDVGDQLLDFLKNHQQFNP